MGSPPDMHFEHVNPIQAQQWSTFAVLFPAQMIVYPLKLLSPLISLLPSVITAGIDSWGDIKWTAKCSCVK